jgi:membrane protein YqaA with SNARE-associated domain
MLRRAYNRVIALAEHPQALWWLALVSFVESSFFPIPPDAMLIPMVLAKPSRAWTIALVCTAASVAGGFLGYAIGYYFFATWGASIIEFYGLQDGFARFQQQFNDYGLWVILIKGLTPIPYKIVTIASGAAHFDLVTFGLASLLTRGVRFFAVAALLRSFGAPIRDFIEKRLTLVTTAFVVILVGGFVALRYL